jgi:hypothetical protein
VVGRQSGSPYVVVGAHQRRYEIATQCTSEDDCRFTAATFNQSGTRLGTARFNWNGDAYVYRGSANWYRRDGGSTCETSGGELVEDAYRTGEEVRVRPTGSGGTSSVMTGTKTISGTPTAAGEAAGCAPFEMSYNVDMNLTP